MASVIEIYEKLGELIQKYPEIKDLELYTCGVDSRLNIFRREPNGPITGLSLEDASEMLGSIEYIEDLIEELGFGVLTEQHKEYLIQKFHFEALSDKEVKDFIKACAIPEEKIKVSIDVIIPELRKKGVTLEQLHEELNYRERNQISNGIDGWNEHLTFCSTEDLSYAKEFWWKAEEMEDAFLIFDIEDRNLGIFYDKGVFILGNNKNGFLIGEINSFSSAWQICDFLKEEFHIELSFRKIMAGFFEKTFGIEPCEALLYLKKYDDLVERAIKEADKEFDKNGIPNEVRDYGEYIAEAEMYANHDEVIGFYMEHYPEDPFGAWNKNIEGLVSLNEQDEGVTQTLEKMFRVKSKTTSLDAKLKDVGNNIASAKNGKHKEQLSLKKHITISV